MNLKQGTEHHRSKIDSCLEFLMNIDKYYETSTIEVKQLIVGSLFSEKLIFEKNNYRIPQLNRAASRICNGIKPFKKNKKGKNTFFSNSSLGVESEGFEPSSKQGIKMLSTCVVKI